MLMDLPSEVGDIDAGVGLTRDVEGVVEELRVATVEVLNGSEGVT